MAPVGGVHRYDWTFADSIAGALARHGLRWMPIIDYTAAWAQSIPGQDHSPPGPGGLRRLRRRVRRSLRARRLVLGGTPGRPGQARDGVRDLERARRRPFLAAGPRPARLRSPVRGRAVGDQGCGPVRAGPDRRGDESARVPPAIIAARPDLRGRIDGVGVHPYGPSPAAIVAAIRTDRTVLRSLSLASVPLYVTEFGWTPRPRGAQDWLPACTTSLHRRDDQRPRAHQLQRRGHLPLHLGDPAARSGQRL